jgi:hypothetical protein
MNVSVPWLLGKLQVLQIGRQALASIRDGLRGKCSLREAGTVYK